MSIKAHCMGMAFPEDGYNGVPPKWQTMRKTAQIRPTITAETGLLEGISLILEAAIADLEAITMGHACLPSAADLDAVAEEQKAKEATSRPR